MPAALGIDRPVLARASLLALVFVVDVANLSRDGGDLLEALVSAAIIQANQAALRHEPSVRQAYGDSGEALPDELRRPISVNAIAQSLRLPFETVRRKVKRLIAADSCVATTQGVYVPQAVIVGARHAAVQSARLARLNRLHDELVRAGVLTAGEALPGPLPDALKRTANRALSEYMLRTSDRVAGLAGGVQEGFVLLGLCVSNARSLIEAVSAGGGGELRPASASSIAARLGLPPETVRRRLVALQASGLARRERGGWMAAAPPAAHAAIAQLLAEQETDLRRLFVRLKELLAGQSAVTRPGPQSGEA